MSHAALLYDVEQPMSLLLENRPYTVTPDGKQRTFCFRPDEIVSVLSLDTEGQVCNDIVTFAELGDGAQKRIVRLPAVASGRLEAWHLSWETVQAALDAGCALHQKRRPIAVPTDGQRWTEWLAALAVPQLNAEYVRRRLCQEHAFNIKAQQMPLVPGLGMVTDRSFTSYIRVQSNLKQHVDVDLSDTQVVFLLGLLPSVGPSAELSNWLKRCLSPILMPEVLNLGRYSLTKFEARLKNTVMQIDSLLQRTDAVQLVRHFGCSLALGIYMPDARMLISIALGDAVVALFDASGELVRSTYSAAPGDASERQRLQRNGYEISRNGSHIVGTEINVSRALGLLAYKSTPTKEYSRAYGAISAMPEISIQRLAANEQVWMCAARGSQLRRTKLKQLGSALVASTAKSTQTLCKQVAAELELSDILLARLDVGATAQM